MRDVIESGLKGMKIKLDRKKSRFRSVEETLEERTTKKLIETTTWYKEKEEYEDSYEEEEFKRKKEKERNWSGDRKVNKE